MEVIKRSGLTTEMIIIAETVVIRIQSSVPEWSNTKAIIT